MSKLQWDKTGEHFYESGVDNVVLYVLRSVAAWNGITAINESPSGAEPSKIYADNEVYGVVLIPEEDALTIEAFAYPELFSRCVGRTQLIPGVYVGQQNRSSFGLCWRTNVYDERGVVGYKIHIAPFLFASSSEDNNGTVNDSPEQKTYSWNATALPVAINEHANTSMIVLDSRWYDKNGLWNALVEIENVLYGSDT
ncbi:MAG: hypothetical protein LIR46_00165, partial [Bacteroidota bacterium]|nr:hypothetical protein [Bacteroidota bacterium]